MSKLVTVPPELHEFAVFEHPLLPKRILKTSGFSWPAFVIGPFWLLWRRLWSQAALAVLSLAGFKFFLTVTGWFKTDLENCDFSSGTLNCDIVVSPWLFFLFQIALNVVCAAYGIRWWSNGLLRRGYIVTDVIKAASPDHVRAILARQKTSQSSQNI